MVNIHTAAAALCSAIPYHLHVKGVEKGEGSCRNERKKKKGRQPERGVMFGCQSEPKKREIRSPKGSTHTQELERERDRA